MFVFVQGPPLFLVSWTPTLMNTYYVCFHPCSCLLKSFALCLQYLIVNQIRWMNAGAVLIANISYMQCVVYRACWYIVVRAREIQGKMLILSKTSISSGVAFFTAEFLQECCSLARMLLLWPQISTGRSSSPSSTINSSLIFPRLKLESRMSDRRRRWSPVEAFDRAGTEIVLEVRAREFKARGKCERECVTISRVA